MITIQHNVEILATNKYGRCVQRVRVHNDVVDTGLDFVRDHLGGGANRINEIAIGTDGTAVTPADTALGVEVFRRRVDRRTRQTALLQFQSLVGFSEANGNTIREAGLFWFTTLVARAVISPEVEKTISIQLTVTHELTIGRP